MKLLFMLINNQGLHQDIGYGEKDIQLNFTQQRLLKNLYKICTKV